MAFGGLLVLIAVVFLTTSNKPNPIENISSELFSWENEGFTTEISKIEDNIYLMKNNDAKEVLRKKISNDPWDNEIYTIKRQIEQLENEIKNQEL